MFKVISKKDKKVVVEMDLSTFEEINNEIHEDISLYEFKFDEAVSADKLISKTIGREYVSPDLHFTDYSDMNESHKKEYDKLDNVDKSSLLNI